MQRNVVGAKMLTEDGNSFVERFILTCQWTHLTGLFSRLVIYVIAYLQSIQRWNNIRISANEYEIMSGKLRGEF